jgi:hypothetical protein
LSTDNRPVNFSILTISIFTRTEFQMKSHFAFYALFIAALLTGSADRSAVAEKTRSLQPLAETICEIGTPIPTSKLFDLFELEVPFLITTDGPAMLAVQATQCPNYRPANIEDIVLVLGYRVNGTATFFVTTIRGELLQAARGQTTESGEIRFVRVERNYEILADFETAKAFWLDW